MFLAADDRVARGTVSTFWRSNLMSRSALRPDDA